MQKIKNLLHRDHNRGVKDDELSNEEYVAPVRTTEPIAAVPIPGTTVVSETETVVPLATRTEMAVDRELVEPREPLAVQEPLVLEGTSAPLLREEPISRQVVEKEVVVQERLHPIEKEEIQPVIHREREQMEVRQITQQLHETQIQPTLIQQRELAPEIRAPIVERGVIEENVVLPTFEREETMRSVQVNAPILNETIKKTIIEEVQPVLERDVIMPTIVQQTQPIFEKIVEAPIVTREVREVRELGTRNTGFETAPIMPVAPVMAAPIEREVVREVPVVQPMTMTTTTTTTDSFLPAKFIQEEELRNERAPAERRVI